MNLSKQTIIYTAGNIVYLVGLWLLTAITTRFLGYEDAGTLTLAMAIGNVIGTVQMYGVRGFQSSDVTFKYSPYDYLRLRVITIIIGFILVIAVCIFMGYRMNVSVTIILFVLLKSSESLADVLFGNIQRAGYLHIAGYSMAIRGVLVTVGFILAATLTKDLNSALLLSAMGAASVSFSFDLYTHHWIIKQQPLVYDKGILGLLKECFPLLVSGLIPVIVAAFPRIVLERYCGSRILGIYGNVSTPGLLLTTVVPTVLTALMTVYGRAFSGEDYRRILYIWMKSIIGVIVFTGVCLVIATFVGRDVLAYIYTAEIIPYVSYLYYVLIAMMLNAITACCNIVFVVVRKHWEMTVIATVALVHCLIVAIPLIRTWRIFGAIITLAGTYCLQIVIQVICIVLLIRNGDKNEAAAP